MNARCHCSNDQMAARGDRTSYQTKKSREDNAKVDCFLNWNQRAKACG